MDLGAAPESTPQGTKESTRDLLLQSAKELFSRHGYSGTTVKDIVDRAGVNVSLVSYHFAGKEGLYRSCLEQFGREKLATAERVLQHPGSAEEVPIRLKLFVDEIFQSFVSEPDLVCMIHRDVEMRNPLIEDVFNETFLQIFKTLVNFLKAAQKGKYIRKGLDPHLLATLFMGSLTQLTRSDHVSEALFGLTLKDEAYRSKAAEHLVKTFLDGALE